MRHNTLAAALALAFATNLCAAQPAAAPKNAQEKRQLTTKLRGTMKDALKDGDSAKLKDEFLSWSDASDQPIITLCGKVNAKNSYGGYQGFGRYMSSTDGRVVLEHSEPEGAFEHIWPIWCSKPL